MKRLDSIQIDQSHIELLQGDLTEIPADLSVDLLVISAFPNNYQPTRTSLIGALDRKGLSVEKLAQSKNEDLRDTFSCWLSQEFNSTHPGLGFHHILCFEPLGNGNPPELVGDIYRALVPILADNPKIRSIAMPIVAAGNQRFPVATMLPPLLDASIHWLKSKLPLEVIRIVAYSEADAEEALQIFKHIKAALLPSKENQPPADNKIRAITNVESKETSIDEAMKFDIFISYAHENTKEMQELETELRHLVPEVRIFLDRHQIDIGSAWQPEIFESLDQCRKIVVLFSPDYLQSKVCKEEFNIAWVRSRESDQEILFPLYLFSAKLPTYMKYRLYIDCREGNSKMIREASRRLLENLKLLPKSDA